MCISNTGFYRPISTAKTWHHGLQLQPAYLPTGTEKTASSTTKRPENVGAPENLLLQHLKPRPVPLAKPAPVSEPPAPAANEPLPFDDISADELTQLLEPRPFADSFAHGGSAKLSQQAPNQPTEAFAAPAPAPAPFQAPPAASVVSLTPSPAPSPVLSPLASPNAAFLQPPVPAAPLNHSLPPVISRPPQDAYVPPCVRAGDGHIMVQHNYHDHSMDPSSSYETDLPARGGVTTPFPLKLHEMLDFVQNSSEGDLTSIISWQQHGRCFVVHKPKEFCELVLPRFFKLSKLASFQRQLNLYGFQRLTRGRDRGGYYHELFLRDRVYLAHAIVRSKVKGTGVRARSNPDQEPNFWAMPWVMPGQTRSVEKPPLIAQANTASSSSSPVAASPNNCAAPINEPITPLSNNTNASISLSSLQQLQQFQQNAAREFCEKLQQHQFQQQLQDLASRKAQATASSTVTLPTSQNNDLGSVFGSNFHFLNGSVRQIQNQRESATNNVVEQPNTYEIGSLDAIPLDFDSFQADDAMDFQDDQAFGNLLEGIVFNEQ